MMLIVNLAESGKFAEFIASINITRKIRIRNPQSENSL